MESMPGVRITDHPDGTWTADVSGPKGCGALLEAQRPWARAEHERGMNVDARHKDVLLKDKLGRPVFAKEHVEDSVAKKRGLVPFGAERWGSFKAEFGPTQMIFNWIAGGWFCTGRWCSTTPFEHSPCPSHGNKDGTMKHQGLHPDPSGSLWGWVDGDWRVVEA